MGVFLSKLIITILSSLVIWVGSSAQSDSFWQNLAQKRTESRWLFAGILVFRLLPFVFVYGLLNEMPRGDVPFFWGKTQVAYQGGMVYQDFVSYHAPLFTYILAFPLHFWYSSKAIVLLMVAIESLLVFATYRLYKTERPDAFKSALLYLILSAPLIMVLLGGQEDIWFWGVALLMLWYFKRYQKDGKGMGAIFSTGLLAIKVTFVFWLFPLILVLKNRVSFLAALAAVGALSAGLLYYLEGTAFLMPLQMTDNLLSPNLYTISRPFLALALGHTPPLTLFSWVGLVLTILVAIWLAFQIRHWTLDKSMPLIFIVTYATMTVIMPTSPGYYAFTYLLPFVFEIIDWHKRREVAMLLLINVLLVTQPFLFTYLQSPNYEDITVLKKPLYLLEYTLQIVNVAAFGWVLFITFQKAKRPQVC
ncbi:MAG: hypothetical protein EAZ32_13125 [Cytophagia bacterium]|nr:MAG: hypothetical protein EAZ38_17685 [Cytophagales bacterium]TAG38180.1 MAG: hypothetical protein EAZ32_13125 [Cytophagia bacterium]TAG72626.1 MAG: hypothetical protein EAZ26_03975 [Runella slithyformis]